MCGSGRVTQIYRCLWANNMAMIVFCKEVSSNRDGVFLCHVYTSWSCFKCVMIRGGNKFD